MAQVPAKKASASAEMVSKAYIVQDGHLPLTEILFDRPGAASPFGDDLSFPLPVSQLTYVPPSPDAFPQHL